MVIVNNCKSIKYHLLNFSPVFTLFLEWIKLSFVNSIRGISQMVESTIISLTSVDMLQGKGFRIFKLALLKLFSNNLALLDYPANFCSEVLTVCDF